MKLESISFIHDSSGSRPRQLVFHVGSEIPKHTGRRIDHWQPDHTALLLCPLAHRRPEVSSLPSDLITCQTLSIVPPEILQTAVLVSLSKLPLPRFGTQPPALFDVLPRPPSPPPPPPPGSPRSNGIGALQPEWSSQHIPGGSKEKGRGRRQE